MKKITTKEALLNAQVYYGPDSDWLELRSLITGDNGGNTPLTVKACANYLLTHPNYSSDLVDKIRKLEKCFTFAEYSVDACPTKSGKGIYLRGGNKRSIAYVMRLHQEKEYFQQITIRDWQAVFTREDYENLNGLDTTNDPVIC